MNVERDFWREKSQLDSQAMKPVDWKYCWLSAPANLKGFNVVFSYSSHIGSAPQEDTDSTLSVPSLVRRMGFELGEVFSSAYWIETCQHSNDVLCQFAEHGSSGAYGVALSWDWDFGGMSGSLVSVEGNFSVRKQTSDASFVGCSCCCYFFFCGFRPILCQMYKVKKTPSKQPNPTVFFQFYENA